MNDTFTKTGNLTTGTTIVLLALSTALALITNPMHAEAASKQVKAGKTLKLVATQKRQSAKQHIQRLQSPGQQLKVLMRRAKQQGAGNFKAPGGPSKFVENCQAGPELIICDECDIDWDEFPPTEFCIVDSVCYDTTYGKPADCP